MFTSARIKLTFWYLAIILAISLSFSGFVYQQITGEVRRGLHLHTLRLIPGTTYNIPNADDENTSVFVPSNVPLEVEIFEEIRKRILFELLMINLGIGVFSTIAGYFLAGKTLHPIEIMMDDQKRFVADASHELRTPLTAMKTEIEVALREHNLLQTEAKALLRSNLEEVDRMQSLTDYLLSMSRYQNTNVQLPFATMESKEVIAKAVANVDHKAKEKHITIEHTSENISFSGNKMSILELLTILLDNAIKYSHKDGRIQVHAKTNKKLIILEVQDFGIGMKESEIPYIFNRFYRAETSRVKSETDGYGLGLSIAKNIVDLHHGKIEVDSEVNKKTIFRISLPL